MGTKVFILFCMIFCHIVDDYYLQGWLASTKQKKWWELNAPEELYKHDYLMALFMHSFSWAFMIMLPVTVYVLLFGGKWFPLLYLLNMIIHFIVDDLKANKKKINLIYDQTMHLIQIVITWFVAIMM